MKINFTLQKKLLHSKKEKKWEQKLVSSNVNVCLNIAPLYSFVTMIIFLAYETVKSSFTPKFIAQRRIALAINNKAT